MPVTVIDDKVWFDSARKLNAICDQVMANVSEGANVLVLSHFQSMLSIS